MTAGSRLPLHIDMSPLVAITHTPPPALERGERSFVGRVPIDFPLALRQHAAYCALLEECGARVIMLDVNREHADAVFVEDTAVVLDEIAVMASPGAESRRAEPPGIERALRDFRDVRRIELPATLDGGDVVVAGRTILVGASARTNEAGANALRAFTAPFGYRVRRVGLHDCLHLKSACCALPDGRLLINPHWLDRAALDGFDVLSIPPGEPFAADFATVGEIVIVSATNPLTARMLRGLGFDVRATPLTEFEKAEGGVTCMSIIFRVARGANGDHVS
jgi:dimethylargininase